MSEASHNAPAAIERDLPDEPATLALGAALARGLYAGAVVHLRGPLGAGKTTLVRGLLGALGHRGRVRSPTYTLVEPYTVSNLDLYHFDFFRLSSDDIVADRSWREHFDGRSVCLIEWPERAGHALPRPDLSIELLPSPRGRTAHLTAASEPAVAWLRTLASKEPTGGPGLS